MSESLVTGSFTSSVVVIICFRELNEKIKEIQNEAAGSSVAYTAAKKSLVTKKDAHAVKNKEWTTLQNQIKRMKKDIAELRAEIERREALVLQLLTNIDTFFSHRYSSAGTAIKSRTRGVRSKLI